MEAWWRNTAETRKQICRAQKLRVDMRRPEERRRRQEEAYEEACYELREENAIAEHEWMQKWDDPYYDPMCDLSWRNDEYDEARRFQPQPELDRRDFVDAEGCGPDVSWLPEISLSHTEWHQRLWQDELWRRRRTEAYLRRSPGYSPVDPDVYAKCTQLRWELVRRHVQRRAIVLYMQAMAEAAEERGAMWLRRRREAWQAKRAQLRWALVRRHVRRGVSG